MSKKAGDDWKSFWDLASPAEAARLLREQYGADATDSAAECARMALADSRDTDHQFWLAVLAHLRGSVS
jgi:hypothetical protein